MPDNRYIVLLNDAFKGHLLGMPTRERERVHEKFEFLQNGIWDAGVRVKKLKGTAGRVIFEARLNKSDRILFTLGRHREKTAVYVWGIARHDDIASEAARIVPHNAPFLDFEPHEREERPDLAIDSLPGEWLSQEDIEEKVPEDYGPQKWIVLDEAEWLRLLAAPHAGSFEGFLFLTREQEALLGAAPPILLSGTAGSGKTTLCVYYLVRGASSGTRRLFLTYNPLLRGLAERIYDGLVANRPGPSDTARPRFLVFQDLLREITAARKDDFPPEREVGLQGFLQIFNDHPDRKKYDAELVWEEIRSIIKGSKFPLLPSRLSSLCLRFTSGAISWSERSELREYAAGLEGLSIARDAQSFIERETSLGDYSGFLRSIADREARSSTESAAVLREVLRLVERRASDFRSPLLSEEEYLALGRKRAPGFLYDRTAIYGIAEFYQDRLARTGCWDEIDLSKAALRLMDGAREEFSYDLVVCDEVQDLSDIQISLLFRLASDPRNVVLTGDPRQIINPTGFRWEEVKAKLYERGLTVPTVRRLSLNFRCVGAVVRLSNALLDLKAALVGLSDTEMRERWKFNGRPPILLAGIAEEELLPRIDFRGAGQVVLTRTVEMRDRLRRDLRTELVFTIAEAKGLEFDTVFLWRFVEEGRTEELWKVIADGGALEDARVPHVRHELALLYVAVTRARNGLVIYDGPEASAIWGIESLAALVFRTGERERLSDLWGTVSSAMEWETQGDYFLVHEQVAAARECYRNAGNEKKYSYAGALLLEARDDFAGAAPLFEAAEEPRRAAECFERASDWRSALPLWTRVGDRPRELRCAACLSESEGAFSDAARAWEDLGEVDRSLENWEKAGEFGKAGRGHAARGNLDRAAELLLRAGLPLEAAACFMKLGNESRAASLFFQGGKYREAASLFRRQGNDEMLFRCYRKLGDRHATAVLHEKRGETRKAMEAFALYVEASPENREKMLASIPAATGWTGGLRAGIRFSALGMPREAAAAFLAAGERDLAAAELEKAGDLDGLAACLQEMGRWMDAVRALDRTALDSEAAISTLERALYRYLDSLPAEQEKAAELLYREAAALRSAGNMGAALARFRLLEDEESAREVYLELGRHEEALRYFLSTGNHSMALRYARSGGVKVTLPLVESLARDLRTGTLAADASILEVFVALLSPDVFAGPEEQRLRLIESILSETEREGDST
jgi:tetratricopeptide (TPR) repeat protein